MAVHAGGRGPAHVARAMGDTYPQYAYAAGFVSSRYRSGAIYSPDITLIPGHSYTRSGAATAPNADLSLASFAANEVRRTTAGVLIEEGRTNLALRSQEFATTWGTFTATVTSDTGLGADGTTTADSLLETTGTNEHYLQQTIAAGPVVNTPGTFSVYASSIGGRYLNLQLFDSAAPANFATCTFDLSGAGAASAVQNGGAAGSTSATIQAVAHGLYRCTLTTTVNSGGADTSWLTRIRCANALSTAAGAVSYTGDAAKGLRLWGAQFSAGAFPTSYIPTAAATVARGADALANTSVSVTGDFTIHGTAVMNAYDGAAQRLFDLNDGTDSNKVRVQRAAGGAVDTAQFISGVQTTTTAAAKPGARTLKFCVTRSGNTITMFLDGASIGSITPASAPAFNRIDVGTARASGSSWLNGTVEFIGILNRAMTSAEAIAVTS